MTDEEKVRAVTATLTDEFYVGRHVRTRFDSVGTVHRIEPAAERGMLGKPWIYVKLGDGTCPPYFADELTLI